MSSVTREAVIEQIKKALEDINPGIVNRPGQQIEDLNFLTDLGLDSLDVINVLFQLETNFKVSFPAGFAGYLVVGSLAGYVADNAE